jgi:hypothetical protein
MSFNSGSHAGIGQQVTANGTANDTARINQLIALANPGPLGLIVKGRVNGQARGWMLQAGNFRSDRTSEAPITPAALLALASAGSELTYTLVPSGSQTRLGVDRDLDGFFDRDEHLARRPRWRREWWRSRRPAFGLGLRRHHRPERGRRDQCRGSLDTPERMGTVSVISHSIM